MSITWPKLRIGPQSSDTACFPPRYWSTVQGSRGGSERTCSENSGSGTSSLREAMNSGINGRCPQRHWPDVLLE